MVEGNVEQVRLRARLILTTRFEGGRRCFVTAAEIGRTFAAGRIGAHVRLLGIFWVALSAFRLIPALVLLFISQPEL